VQVINLTSIEGVILEQEAGHEAGGTKTVQKRGLSCANSPKSQENEERILSICRLI